MNKAIFFFLLIFPCTFLIAQIPSEPLRVIEIIEGLSLREKTIDSATKIETLAGKALLKEGNTKFSCDSAIINRKLNTIEAFGNVHINDADSLHTYSQYLKYYGNDRVAFLKRDVRLTDNKGTLFTNDLEYDLKTGIGKYHNGGKIINGKTLLTSDNGVYYADTKDVYFKNNVYLKDPNNTTTADSLLYNTQTQIVTIIGPTHSKSKDADIYTTEGTYDLKTGNSSFGSRTLIKDSSGRIYQANTIAIDDKSSVAQLEGNAIIKDSANGLVVTANQIFLNKNNNSFLATRKPVMIIQRENDSTYISADTLFSGFTTVVTGEQISIDSVKSHPVTTDSVTVDSAAISTSVITNTNKRLAGTDSIKPQRITDSIKINTFKKTDAIIVDSTKSALPNISLGKIDSTKAGYTRKDSAYIDSIKTDSVKFTSFKADSLKKDSAATDTVRKKQVLNISKPDTSIRYFLAFHHVKIFNDSLQSVCDSLFYSAEDSIFRLFKDPVVWSGESQVTGDTIHLYTKNKKPERVHVFENAMMINQSKKDLYNQVAGKTINGYFNNGAIDYVRAKGSPAESVYYIQDEDSAYVGMNRASGDVIDLYFIKQELNKVKFVNDVHGIMHPIRNIPEDQKLLKNFNWQDKRRPKTKLELFE